VKDQQGLGQAITAHSSARFAGSSAFSSSVSLLVHVSYLSRIIATAAVLGASLLAMVPQAAAAGSVNGKTIVVDPGHGGKDPGAVDNGVQEKSITLAVGRQLAGVLQAQGARVVMTRDSDVSLAPSGTVDADLQARVNLAQQSHASAFVSIHGNEAADPNANGATTFYGPVCGFYSGVKLSPADVSRSYSLAQKVQAAIVSRTHERDNGAQSAAFWVLGNPGVPAILVETAFLSNKSDAAKLVDPGHQHLLVDAIADGLNGFFNSGDAGGAPAPKDGLAGCAGTSPKDDRSQALAERWVQTVVPAPLLSGPDDKAKIFSTLAPFTHLKVLGQNGDFLNVLNPSTNGPGYVEAKNVGPSGPPPAPAAFEPFWVQSFRATQLWSGPSDGVSFGPLPVWSYVQVLAPSATSRFYVRVAATGNVAYVDRADVGPSGAPTATPASAEAAAAGAPAARPSTVVVAAGDTLLALAGKVGVSVADLTAANQLSSDGTIRVGQKLLIPSDKAAPTSSTTAGSTASPSVATTVTIAPGDTLSGIAARSGVTVSELTAVNHLSLDGLLKVGQKLALPTAGSPAVARPATAPNPTSITVGAGDTLSALAARVGVSIETLVALNHLAAPDAIQAGQTLKLG